MTERHEEKQAERVDKMVDDLLKDRHLKAKPTDAGESGAIRAAASLAGARQGFPHMTAAFRRRLERLLEVGETSSPISRRALLGAGLAGAAGLAGGVLAQRQLGLGLASHSSSSGGSNPGYVGPPGGRNFIAPVASQAKWWDTGVTFEDLEEGIPRRVSAGSVGAFVIRKGSALEAYSAYCTHLPCELQFVADRAILNCPCHDMPFNLDGESIATTYKLPTLPLVQARVVTGRVEVLGTK